MNGKIEKQWHYVRNKKKPLSCSTASDQWLQCWKSILVFFRSDPNAGIAKDFDFNSISEPPTKPFSAYFGTLQNAIPQNAHEDTQTDTDQVGPLATESTAEPSAKSPVIEPLTTLATYGRGRLKKHPPAKRPAVLAENVGIFRAIFHCAPRIGDWS